MRINELIQTGTRTEQRERIIPATYDENGEILTEETTEVYDVEVPVMDMVYRDATPEEIAEMERERENMPEPEPTAEELAEDAYLKAEYNSILLEMIMEG